MVSRSGLSPHVRRWIIEAVGPGATITAVRHLKGATSSTLHAVDVALGGWALELVLRRFTRRGWVAEEPDLAMHEAANLRRVAVAGIPVPELVACDPNGARCGVPAVLMTRLPGRVDLRPDDVEAWLRQMAEALISLHRLDPQGHAWTYAPYNDVAALSVPAWSGCPELWARAIEIVQGPWPGAPERLIHRDYHPNNVLWQGGRLSGIVDWPNACRGPAGIDVAWCRMNLKSTHGVEIADRFLDAYLSLAGRSDRYDPFWDLMVIVEELPGPPNVYPPWVEYGVRGLSAELLIERADAYLASVLARL